MDRFNRDQNQWGDQRIRFHDLRHTAATLMLSHGVDIKSVQEILGHENITTTMIYVHMLGNRIKEISKMHSITPTPTSREKPKLMLIR